MSKCRYDLSEDCNNKDCLKCVLEKIKAEIDDLDRYFDNYYFSGNKEPMFKCKEVFEILDKRIVELKGETE